MKLNFIYIISVCLKMGNSFRTNPIKNDCMICKTGLTCKQIKCFLTEFLKVTGKSWQGISWRKCSWDGPGKTVG